MIFIRRYLIPRLIQYLLVIFVGVTTVFLIPRFLPSDPVVRTISELRSRGSYLDPASIEAMVADLTGPFTQKHPNVRVSILSRTSVEILTGIEALDLEAGITYLDNEPLGRVAQVPLYTEFYRLLIAPGSELSGRRQVSWGDLATVPLCLLTSDMQNRRIVNQHLGEAGVDSVPMIESNSTMALVAHVLTGHWASVVPKKLADMFVKDGRLQSVPIVEPEAEHTVGLIAARRDPQTPVLQALVDEAVRLFR